MFLRLHALSSSGSLKSNPSIVAYVTALQNTNLVMMPMSRHTHASISNAVVYPAGSFVEKTEVSVRKWYILA